MERFRNFFRIEYPAKQRPTFSYNGEEYEVINISEQGIKFKISPKKCLVKVGSRIRGSLKFTNPDDLFNKCDVEGMILRKNPLECALKLDHGVPLKKIMVEQRYLIRKFGTVKQPEFY